jgi:uncharacterized protein YcbK (DUF882 family)
MVLKVEGSRARRGNRAVTAALLSILMASCSAASLDGDTPFGLAVTPEFGADSSSDFAAATVNSAAQAPMQSVFDENDPALPDTVAGSPSLRPGSEAEAAQIAAAAPAQPLAQQPQPVAEQTQDEAFATAALAPDQQAAPAEQVPAEAQPQMAEQAPEAEPASETSPQLAMVQPAEPKKRGFLSAFFAPSKATAAPAPSPVTTSSLTATPRSPSPAAAQPLIQQASTGPIVELGARAPLVGSEALPGVRTEGLFEITRRSGVDDDSDVDVHEDSSLYQVASAAGLARLAPNGLRVQHEDVDVACLKPSLVRVLKTIENHFGQKVVITSGYRNPERNRKARGARNSLHMYCAAADIQVPGVGKAQLASFVRAMPGRGGVGTYCHTESVHVDVGPERDWNWRCRRRK